MALFKANPINTNFRLFHLSKVTYILASLLALLAFIFLLLSPYSLIFSQNLSSPNQKNPLVDIEKNVATLISKTDSPQLTEYIPAESAPAESTPAESTPAESSSAESTFAESTPAESTIAESTPAESSPAEASSAESSSAEFSFAESTLAESTLAESTLAESTLAESTLAESTPAESTPAESVPAESIPAESIPAEHIPSKPIEQTLNVSDLPIFRCTYREKMNQVNSFTAEKKKWSIYKLGCAEPIRMESFLAQIWPLSKRPITLVNIGANKGYNLVKWLETWSPESEVNSKSWFAHLKQLYPGLYKKYNLCGTCGYCRENLFHFHHHAFFDPTSNDNDSHGNGLRVIGIEPSTSNFDLLLKLKKWVNHSSVEMYNYASSDVNGEAKFPKTRLGLTTASLSHSSKSSSSSSSKFQTVKVVTVDAIMSELSISSIDFLLIDTEGYDPLVLKGAENALSAGNISLIEFEYHGIGPWKATSLAKTVKFLKKYNYDCYFKFPGTLVRLTHCFHSSFEFHDWSNVLCVYRGQTILNSYLLSHCHWL